jgi:hypothetical protein
MQGQHKETAVERLTTPTAMRMLKTLEQTQVGMQTVTAGSCHWMLNMQSSNIVETAVFLLQDQGSCKHATCSRLTCGRAGVPSLFRTSIVDDQDCDLDCWYGTADKADGLVFMLTCTAGRQGRVAHSYRGAVQEQEAVP